MPRRAPGRLAQAALSREAELEALLAAERGRSAALERALADARREADERAEQQSATGRVLESISRSPVELQAVFDAIAQSAARLCGAEDALLQRLEGGSLVTAARAGSDPL